VAGAKKASCVRAVDINAGEIWGKTEEGREDTSKNGSMLSKNDSGESEIIDGVN
jgi:hypothetical protein